MRRAIAGVLALPLAACALLAGLEDSQLDTRVPPDAPDAPDAAALEAAFAEDAPAGTDTADAPPPLAPGDLGAGLVVWLDAMKGLTIQNGKVSRWADQSTHGNDAAQSQPTARPTVATRAIGQYDAIAFGSSALSVPDAPSMQWGHDDYLIEVVAEYNNVANGQELSGYGAFWNKGSQKFPYPGPALFGNTTAGPTTKLAAQVKTPSDTSSLGWVTSALDGLNDGKWRVYGARRVGQTKLEARVNGAPSSATIADVDVSSLGEAAWIGSAAGMTGQILFGDIAEIVAYHGPISDDDVARLEAYLRAKYGI